MFLFRRFEISQVFYLQFSTQISLSLLSDLKKKLVPQDGNDTFTVFTFVQVFYLLSFNLYKYDITLFSFFFFFKSAQLIDNSFTVSTSAAM